MLTIYENLLHRRIKQNRPDKECKKGLEARMLLLLRIL